jgi:hypothetical protein
MAFRSIPCASVGKTFAAAGALSADVDIATLHGPCVGVRVGAAGDLTLELPTGQELTIPAVLAGETVWAQAVKIIAATTSAQKLTVWWDETSTDLRG